MVATIPSLKGRPLEAYANLLFRHWGLGQAGENNGVLLLVAKNDRKIRIEVGYGLEGALTDALAKTIIDTVILPNFRQQRFSVGILDGAEMITRVLSGDGSEHRLNLSSKTAVSTKTKPVSSKKTLHIMKTISQVGLYFLYFLIAAALFTTCVNILAMIFGTKIGPGRYKWLGFEIPVSSGRGGSSDSSSYGGSSSSGSFGGGGGGSSGGGGASGSW